MKFKERIEKIKLFFNIDEELQTQSSQLEETRKKVLENENELKEEKGVTIIKNWNYWIKRLY